MNRYGSLTLYGLVLIVLIMGCSKSDMLVPDNTSVLSESGASISDIGILGAYDLTINSENNSADLVPKRMGSIGESYLVSGLTFFTSYPCRDCLIVNGVRIDSSDVSLRFRVRHPFEPGEPLSPSSGKNRLDLDIFDLAILFRPKNTSPVTFPLLDVTAYHGVVANADGYTKELADLITDPAALPYKLVVDDSQNPLPHTWNKFAMGAESECDVRLIITPGTTMSFDLYLTMGYGASAEFTTRLDPKYYNPEFNRKAAWKIVVVPPYALLDTPTTSGKASLFIWDWQQSATVYGNPADFENAPADNIYENSDVEFIDVEIPSMTQLSIDPLNPVSGTGMPGDPLRYDFSIQNETSQPAGYYTGIVKVTDKRSPKAASEGRDFLIHSPKKGSLATYEIPELATYQTFTVEVVHDGITIQQVDYDLDGVIQDDSSHGSVTVGYEGPPGVKYFNLTIDGGWLLQNMPAVAFSGVGEPQALTFDFYLGVADGVHVESVLAGWSLDDAPRGVAPPGSDNYILTKRKIRMYSGRISELITAGAPARFNGDLVREIATIITTMWNQDCGLMECVPAGVSNGLLWLRYFNGIPDESKDASINALKPATFWSSSGCPANWDDPMTAYLNVHNYGLTVEGIPSFRPTSYAATATDCDAAIQAIQDGKAVQIDGLTHVARVVSMAKFAGGGYTITVAHDTNQGNPGGQIIESFYYSPGPGFPIALGGAGFNGKRINGFVAEK